MDFFTLVGLSACIYFLIYVISLLFIDCDLQLAFYEKFGRKLVKLRGKVIWVTGASTAVGTMMALEAAKQHGKLALSSNSLKELEKIKALCFSVNPFLKYQEILILHFDVGETTKHRAAVEKVLRHFGKLDILIMNEDKLERGAWEDMSQTNDRILFQSNLFAVLSLSRVVVRYFNSRQKGKLAVTSSIAGLIGVPYSGCYTGAKHALHGYFDSLRFEKIGDNIQTILLCLGSSELLQEKFTSNDDKPLKFKSNSMRKMTAERCAHLCLAAVVNDLDEAWIAIFPVLPLIYGIKYFPNVTKSLLKYLKPKERVQRGIIATNITSCNKT